MSIETSAVKLYVRVYVALLLLLALTVGAAFIPSGRHAAMRDILTGIAFLIAGTKAVLIVLWFMHVKHGTRITWIFAASGFVWLGILFVLTFNDYLSRAVIPGASKEPPSVIEQSGEAHDFVPVRASDPVFKK